MKKLKLGLLAVLFTVGIGGAFVQKIHAAPKLTDASYMWLKFNEDGSREPSGDETATIAKATTDYGCSGSNATCATGSKVAGSGTGPSNPILQFN